MQATAMEILWGCTLDLTACSLDVLIREEPGQLYSIRDKTAQWLETQPLLRTNVIPALVSTPVPRPWFLDAVFHSEELELLGEMRVLHGMGGTEKIQDEPLMSCARENMQRIIGAHQGNRNQLEQVPTGHI